MPMKNSRKQKQETVKANKEHKEEIAHEKLVFTKENVNGYLVDYLANPKKYNIVGILTYLFKTFQNEPAELLAKIKILTSKNKGIPDVESVQKAVMFHTFAIFKMKGDFFQNMFQIMKTEGFLPQLICSFYFKNPMSSESVDEHLSVLFSELQKVFEPTASLTLEEFKSKAAQLMEVDDLENCKLEEVEGNDSSSESENEEEKPMESIVEEHNKELEDSDFTLISLEDDEKIAALDKKLGSIFNKSTLSEETVEFVQLVSQCIELLVQNNYISEIDWIWSILYFSQFSHVALQVKFILKDFIGKFSDKSLLFKIFSVGSLIIPSIYSLYTTFTTYCEDEFDYSFFFKNSLAHGYSSFLLDRIDSSKYYAFYESGMGEVYDEFYKALILKESKMERLEEQKARELPGELAEVVANAMSGLMRRRAKRIKNRKRSAKRKAKLNGEIQEEASAEDKKQKKVKKFEEKKERKTGDKKKNKSEEKPEQRVKKSFAEKIGKKLAKKKAENKKNFRYTNEDGADAPKSSIIRKKEYFKKRFKSDRGKDE